LSVWLITQRKEIAFKTPELLEPTLLLLTRAPMEHLRTTGLRITNIKLYALPHPPLTD
jgi:hypothetical protein